MNIKTATCFCQSIEISFTTPAIANLMCHCSICRKMHSAVANHVLMFPESSFHINKCEQKLIAYSTSPRIIRHSCSVCGSSIYNKLSMPDGSSFISSFPSLFNSGLSEEDKIPNVHIFYGNRIMNFYDGKPKFQDMAKEFNGSGILLNDSGDIL